LANFYASNKRIEEAEASHRKALDIRKQLARKNPAAYDKDVAETLTNLGSLYLGAGRLSEADAAYGEALRIYRELALASPSVYKPYTPIILESLARLDMQTGDLAKAEIEAREAVETSSEMWKENPALYNDAFARRQLLEAQLLEMTDSDPATACALLHSAGQIAQEVKLKQLAIIKSSEYCAE
jgi:nephrocystin-3